MLIILAYSVLMAHYPHIYTYQHTLYTCDICCTYLFYVYTYPYHMHMNKYIYRHIYE